MELRWSSFLRPWARMVMDPNLRAKPREQAKNFGIGFHVRLAAHKFQVLWTADATNDIRDQVDAIAISQSSVPSGPNRPTMPPDCFFGHKTCRIFRQRSLPVWRGAPYNAILCQNCFLGAKDETAAPGCNVLWLARAPPPSQRVTLHGPCFRGCKRSSSTSGNGRMTWHALPPGIVWENVPADATPLRLLLQKGMVTRSTTRSRCFWRGSCMTFCLFFRGFFLTLALWGIACKKK